MAEEIRPRSTEEIIRAQRAALASPEDQRAFRDRILTSHTRERRRVDPGTGRTLAIGEITDRAVPLLVVWDHILVRAEDAQKAAKELGSNFNGPFPIDCGECISLPVVRFEAKKAMDLTEIAKAVKKLHKKKINASFNHVLPDGGIKGGQGTPQLLGLGRSPPSTRRSTPPPVPE